MTDLVEWLQRTGLARAIGGTPYLYAVLESLHILGLAVLVGSALTFDLRLLGVGPPRLAVTTAARHLLPVARIGFAVAAVTGLAMFIAGASSLAGTGAAPWKLGLLVVAGLNIAVFHAGVYKGVGAWDTTPRTPVRARIAGIISACSWTGVVIAGRMLAYT